MIESIRSGKGNREEDLMTALKNLLDKLNSGNIPLSQQMWEQLKTGKPGSSNVTNINITGAGTHMQVRLSAMSEILSGF